jgi:hypothetical protein
VLGARQTYRRKFTGNVSSRDLSLNHRFAVVQFFSKVLSHIGLATNVYPVFRSRFEEFHLWSIGCHAALLIPFSSTASAHRIHLAGSDASFQRR